MGLLYEAEAKGLPAAEVLAALPVDPDPLAVALVEGVAARRAEIDGLLAEPRPGLDARAHAGARPLRAARSPPTSCWRRPDVPTAVVLDEAVELAKRFCTDDSGQVRQRHAGGHRQEGAAVGLTRRRG